MLKFIFIYGCGGSVWDMGWVKLEMVEDEFCLMFSRLTRMPLIDNCDQGMGPILDVSFI